MVRKKSECQSKSLEYRDLDKKVDDFIAELKSYKTPDSIQYHLDKINFHLKIIAAVVGILFFMDICILVCSLVFLIKTVLNP